jgi:hypothetical protein
MMQAYWLTFEGRGPGCVQAEGEYDAKVIGTHVTGCEVKKIEILPYPATPRLSSYKHPKYGECPSFCMEPEVCKGRTSCPQRHSCTE